MALCANSSVKNSRTFIRVKILTCKDSDIGHPSSWHFVQRTLSDNFECFFSVYCISLLVNYL